MYPDPLFSILGLRIYFYVFAYGIGFALAFGLALVLTREHGGIPFRDLLAAAVILAVADLFLTPVLVWIIELFGLDLPANWSLGQILAVLIALAVYHRVTSGTGHVAFSDRLDIAAPPVMLFMAIARLGCLAAGCCYGIPAPGLPWAITFTNPRAISIYKNIPVHPTQLYDSIGALAILGIVLAVHRRARWRGRLMWLALGLYAGLRFVIEFYRGDPRPMLEMASYVLSLNQVLCIVLAVLCGSILVWRRERRPVASAAPGRAVSTSA